MTNVLQKSVTTNTEPNSDLVTGTLLNGVHHTSLFDHGFRGTKIPYPHPI